MAVVTVQVTVGGFLSDIGIDGGLDVITDFLGKSIGLEFVAAELDKNGLEKETIKGYAQKIEREEDEVKYEFEFEVPSEFGEIGAVLVQNEYQNEIFLKQIQLDGFPNGPLIFSCDSWVQSKNDVPDPRIFFTNKSYLPSETPSGITLLREKELTILRGDGTGERKDSDRIYDYDVYNDLGNPDASDDLVRPVLGGKKHPYPRRIRTGRPRSKKDPLSESRSASMYVPRDEAFSEIKSVTFSAKTVFSVLHSVIPSLETAIVDSELGFPYFTKIDSLYNEGVDLPLRYEPSLKNILPRIVKGVTDSRRTLLRFETPEMLDRDKFAWIRDEEFCRQALAGLNPYSIQLVKEWPITSKLDPSVYGSQDSLITKELVEEGIKGYTTLEEAIAGKNLFLLDYHDLLLPFVNKVREQKGTTLYGSRTLMFLTPIGTLRPLAIELTRPPGNGKPRWREVFRPCWDATGAWQWKLAKAHVLAHDSGYHQLVSHFLRTHAVTEPYIIATNRQLSAMHPIYRLLQPHFRYTMEINALARLALINAGGTVETCFSPLKHSMELGSAAYDLQWRFDREALPADLIARGMAEEDPTAPHGIKLAIEDYPFANDGLILYDAIKQWVTDYVTHYYRDPAQVESDVELHLWWTEIRTKGHADKKDEPWWPQLKTPNDLIGILTTMIWVASGHHSAVNFGQYTYGGYFPNRPTIARTNMPSEDRIESKWESFKLRPEDELLACFPSQIQATRVMAILDVLSTHSVDEEYIGDTMEPSFKENPVLKAAYEIFTGRLMELDGIIDARNNDEKLKNRNGVGVVPYELMKPLSGPGVTSKGVPNSISI
jgi:lipoxygenase